MKRWKWGGENSRWVVDGLRDEKGERIRKFFPSRDAANEWLRERRPELKNQGRAALTMTDVQRIDAVRALGILQPYGANLTQAAEAFVSRAQLLERTVTFAALREELVTAKRADKMSERYLGDLKNRLAAAGKHFDEQKVATIEARALDDWLRGLQLAPISRVNFRKVLHTAFEFAVSRGYARDNPVSKTAEVKADVAAPGILLPIEIQALLNACTTSIIPWVAIAAFAGLRDAELGRLTWDLVDLAGGHIKVDAAIAKTASRRLVPISENLRAWLTPHAKKMGPVRGPLTDSYSAFRDARRAAFEALNVQEIAAPGLEVWPHNALRHSFASYRMALITNAAQVAEECGNSVQIMKQHYRELVTKEASEAWFGVKPGSEANILVFSKLVSA